MRSPSLLGTRFREVARVRPRSLLSPFLDVDRTGEGAGERLTGLGAGPPAPFCAVLLDLDGPADGGVAECGLTTPGGPVLARLDVSAGTAELVVAGVVVRTAPLDGRAPRGLACVVNENQVSVLLGAPDGDWTPVLTERAAVAERVDLRDPAVLGAAEYACAASGLHLRRVRAGCSGPAGVRDPQVVRTTDGRPLVRDGRLYLTMTSAGLGFFQQASWGVWAIDPADPARVDQVAALYSSRDGLLLGDHAGQLVVDEATGTTTVLVSSWGDHDPATGVHVRTATTSDDLLSGVHVLATARLDLPTAAGAWDPSLARIGGRWHLAFTECESFGPPRYVFHPALAVTDSGDPTRGLVRVAADAAREQTEGTLLVPSDGTWYLLASDRDAAEYPVYDTALRQLGALRAPYGSNIPHPMVLPGGTDGRTPWLVTFDGTPWHEDLFGYGTHGDLVVMAHRPETAGEVLRRSAGEARRSAGVVRRRLRERSGR
ncbi:hypothetical protein JOD57_001572 [Geodermatophilus bullaregiensis]|uniref:hypothetical protein n=1 Tax=Geodermatophilus bullaregiensis TaxID=1564160 RepID=UPI00195983C6|nr:hypothetical protein [Geodermatophilus bullaregiensis]MBM7805735.1 hypothetical protein [Geodermatophilus bullaregiensis]